MFPLFCPSTSRVLCGHLLLPLIFVLLTRFSILDSFFVTANLCVTWVIVAMLAQYACCIRCVWIRVIHCTPVPLDSMFLQENTRQASSLHSHTLQMVKCHTSQFQRCFLPRAVRLWNSLAGDTCAAGSMHTFKSKANKNLRSIWLSLLFLFLLLLFSSTL